MQALRLKFSTFNSRAVYATVSAYKGQRLRSACSSYFSSKVPDKPVWLSVDPNSLPEVPEIDFALVEQLERISLLEFNNEAGLRRLHSAVKSANRLHQVNTEGVEPMNSVLEDRELYLRDDCVTEGGCTEDILSNAVKTEENYFVAPPGNIPLKNRDKQHLSNVLDVKSKVSKS